MRKLYCDRCKKEVEKLYEIAIPDRIISHGDYLDYLNKQIDVCGSCQAFIEKTVRIYNAEAIEKRFAFYKTLIPDQIDVGGETE